MGDFLSDNTFSKESFTRTLRELRKAKGLTQGRLAESIGVSDKTYSKWETGEYEPDMAALARLAQFYGISPAVFFGSEAVGEAEAKQEARFGGLSGEECVQKAFEMQFQIIRGLVKHAMGNREKFRDMKQVQVPPNRVNAGNEHAITAFSEAGAYGMMYNGNDANIALSFLPARENYGWLREERSALASFFSLLGEEDMLHCFATMMTEDFAEQCTAEFLAECMGIGEERAEEVLNRAADMGLCSRIRLYIGSGEVYVYSLTADSMLVGLLTLAHLSLPQTEKNGCYYYNSTLRNVIRKEEK